MILGITGGIACGKSLAGHTLEGIGVPVIDADEVSHFITKYEPKVIDQIVKTFGECVLTPHGMIDRKVIADIVFASSEERAKLEKILHPKIKRVLSTVIKHAREKKFNLALVAPLLIESNFTQMVDVVWVIKSDARIMVERLKREFKISEVQAFRRINAQLPISEKEAYAHYVIENNGKIEDFKRRVIKTWNKSLSDFSAGKLPLPGSSKK